VNQIIAESSRETREAGDVEVEGEPRGVTRTIG
jgi:hypothetical protein